MSDTNGVAKHDSIGALLRKVSENQAVVSPKYEISKTTAKGDGYMGIIDAVKIKGDGREVLSVITKTASQNKVFREQAKIRRLYFHETLLYNEIFPAFYQFQLDKGIEDLFNCVPKCYATSMVEEQEGLVFENLRDSGYSMWNRMIPMDDAHIALTLRTYAKFHALSLAFKDQHREKFDMFCGQTIDLYEEFITNPMHSQAFESVVKSNITALDPEEDKEHLQKFMNFLNTSAEPENKTKFLSRTMDEYVVIAHGDCWCNNLMYTYEDKRNPEKPTGIRILDFQGIRCVSPIIDLTHFFYTASSKKAMDNYRYYLNIYYETLSDFVKQLGSDPEKVYPRCIFDSHWQKYCTNGLNVAMLMIKVMSSDAEEAPDFASATDSEKSVLEAMIYEPKNSGYKKRIRDVIVHFSENNFI